VVASVPGTPCRAEIAHESGGAVQLLTAALKRRHHPPRDLQSSNTIKGGKGESVTSEFWMQPSVDNSLAQEADGDHCEGEKPLCPNKMAPGLMLRA